MGKLPEQTEAAPALARFLFDRLKEAGVTEVFGVPGDYNFTLLDELERCEGIAFVGGRNELNAGYAADAYARIRGLSALITTFGVGEMSAVNAIAGASSEQVPIVHIVGAPPAAAKQEKKRMHHTLMDGNYDVFRRVYEPLAAYTAWLTPENAAVEIPAALRIALEQRQPVYLAVCHDLADRPIQPRGQVAPAAPASPPAALQAAVEHARHLMDPAAGETVLLADAGTDRFRLQEPVRRLAETLGLPVAASVLGKGAFDESHPQFIGIYAGAFGSPVTAERVERAGCVVAVGPVWADTNLAHFTAKLDPARVIEVHPTCAKVAEAEFPGVRAEEFLTALAGSVRSQPPAALSTDASAAFPPEAPPALSPEAPPALSPEAPPARPAEDPREIAAEGSEPGGEPAEGAHPQAPLTAGQYYPRLQRLLREGDILVVETGSFFYGMSQLRLPRGATYIAEGGWQAIGYATPAAFGACVAAPERRVLLFTGDGSLQLTVQEISSMLAYGCRPILFVLNNASYTIENYLNVNVSDARYNRVPVWSYTRLPEAFGGDAFVARATTAGELDEAIREAERECSHRLCLLELVVNDPLDAPDYMRKLRSYLEERKRQGFSS
ncbi:alpha-keto acid decarboxylase family protein [Gorillibacterium sp. sgz500922]|uniref:alpha-keto acid decarboxylase family protein n=1 Tax=Gorillibacterium sp. sgz500922 TaxID=3446694 RepID=UPI003F66E049